MNRQTMRVSSAVAGVLLFGGVVIAGCGGGDRQLPPALTRRHRARQRQPAVPVAARAVAASNPVAASRSGGGSQSGSSNQSPIIPDVQPFPDFGGENSTNQPFLDLEGHAYDPDGKNDQNVNRVEVSWGDGNSTTITTFANNAFARSTATTHRTVDRACRCT